MNESCYKNVKTKITIQPKSSVSLDMKSLFNGCRVIGAEVECSIDTLVKYTALVEAVGTETVRVDSHGSTIYKASIKNNGLSL